MDPSRRNTPHLRFKKLHKAGNLLALSKKIGPISKTLFAGRYGQILKLLTMDVDMGALVALSQYYDPPLRCFTFQDFQLAPTIEEFERILGWPLKNDLPFTSLGDKLVLEDVAAALHLSVRDVAPILTDRGISRKFLEGKAEKLGVKENWQENWPAFSAILALLIFGVVMFPSNDDDYVSQPAISVFLSKNPVPALLADVYLNLHVRHEKKKGVVMCCAPLLYSWLESHIPQKGPWVDILRDLKWSQKLASLTAAAIVWYLPNWDVGKVITHCGGFPNVPLIGSQGCINYNPMLALRQLGYPLETEPNMELLKDFILLDFGKEAPDMLRKIKRAWTRIHRKGRELGKRDCVGKEPYREWVMKRVKSIKLPYTVAIPFPHPEPAPTHAPIEEVNELKATIQKMEEERLQLQATATRFALENENLRSHLQERDIKLEESRGKANVEEDLKLKYYENMTSSDSCILRLRRELKQTQKERGEAYGWEENALKEKGELRRKFEAQVLELQNSLKDTIALLEQETYLKEEALISHQVDSEDLAEKTHELSIANEQVNHWRDRYNDLRDQFQGWIDEIQRLNVCLDKQEETIQFQEAQNQQFYAKYSGLVRFCNQLVEDIPMRLRSAVEDIEENHVPPAVHYFITLCDKMMQRFKSEMKDLKPRRGQEF